MTTCSRAVRHRRTDRVPGADHSVFVLAAHTPLTAFDVVPGFEQADDTFVQLDTGSDTGPRRFSRNPGTKAPGVSFFPGLGTACRETEDIMAEKRNDAERIGRRAEGTDDQGVLPDGVRGTTRDLGHTKPADEHAGYTDPTKPELRKPS